jgi:hypothetical protein
MQDFDACLHQIRRLAIKAGKEIRKAKGLPEEKNITLIYNEVAPLLGLSPEPLDSLIHGSKTPSPHETMVNGRPLIPRADCPQCGEKDTLIPSSICRTCEDWEQGFRSRYRCLNCNYEEKFTKTLSEWASEVNPDWRGGMKAEVGIEPPKKVE